MEPPTPLEPLPMQQLARTLTMKCQSFLIVRWKGNEIKSDTETETENRLLDELTFRPRLLLRSSHRCCPWSHHSTLQCDLAAYRCNLVPPQPGFTFINETQAVVMIVEALAVAEGQQAADREEAHRVPALRRLLITIQATKREAVATLATGFNVVIRPRRPLLHLQRLRLRLRQRQEQPEELPTLHLLPRQRRQREASLLVSLSQRPSP